MNLEDLHKRGENQMRRAKGTEQRAQSIGHRAKIEKPEREVSGGICFSLPVENDLNRLYDIPYVRDLSAFGACGEPDSVYKEHSAQGIGHSAKSEEPEREVFGGIDNGLSIKGKIKRLCNSDSCSAAKLLQGHAGLSLTPVPVVSQRYRWCRTPEMLSLTRGIRRTGNM
jgi:hypothetical protein